ncbi:hypothetical protein [Streptomyces sp. RFCAC02]|uniref:hypothetical protein n=1 Tax=Streptomyces sp. RFCAC02 TaxID=2499143 RepID=UPI001F10CC35|nr:hypothetical protein [Streptomyces sp. RFCAC02]
MNADSTAWEERSTVQVVPPLRPRRLAKVPFVELAEGRLQGIVSSGTDLARVYVSSIEARTHGMSCRTNNNRPCAGLGGYGPCKHVHALAKEGVAQYGIERVARYLHVDPDDSGGIWAGMQGGLAPSPAAGVFNRFLRYLAYLEKDDSTEPLPELHWFPATGAGR